MDVLALEVARGRERKRGRKEVREIETAVYRQKSTERYIYCKLTAISLQADIDIPVPSINFKAYSFGSSLKM